MYILGLCELSRDTVAICLGMVSFLEIKGFMWVTRWEYVDLEE